MSKRTLEEEVDLGDAGAEKKLKGLSLLYELAPT